MAWQVPGVQSLRADDVLVQEAQRSFMAKVYRWMFAGLALTGGVALFVASTPDLLMTVLRLTWPLAIAQLLLVFALSAVAQRLSAPVAGAMFVVYAVLNGLLFSGIFVAYHLGSVAQAFLLTAGVYGAMSVYGTVTRKNLSAWASFLFMGLIGVVLASVVQMFWPSPGLSFVTSCASVLVFAGLTAYDHQKLRRIYAQRAYAGFDGAPASDGNLAIVGALTLYLDFINLFLSLLRLLGRRN